MKNIGQIILRSIYNNNWLKIEYQNSKNEITKFLIGIKDIDYTTKIINCDCFNIMYASDCKNINISFDSILSAYICDNTFFNTPKLLIEKIELHREEFSFLNSEIQGNNILDYYSDCFRLDVVPYINDYVLLPGIDVDTLMVEDQYDLSNEQFEKMSKDIFKVDNDKLSKKTFEKLSSNELVCNVLSINTKKGLYLLAYKRVNLDIANKKLIGGKSIIINYEFSYNSDIKKIENIESIHKFIPEEYYELLKDFDVNKLQIIEIIKEYNKNKNPNDFIINTNPYFINLSRKYSINVDKELSGIRQMINGETEMSKPVKVFLGESNIRSYKRKNFPIYTVDDKFDIDQINAIHIGMKSNVSYIQGPPGTGKTQTILNALLTALLNDKTVLVSSNNNIPIDGVYDNILKLEYKPGIGLLFPAIRLGNSENCANALAQIKKMRLLSKDLTPRESYIQRIKEERIAKMEELTNILDNYNKISSLREKKEGLEKLLSFDSNSMVGINLQLQIDEINQELHTIDDIDLDKFKEFIKSDNKFFMAVHYETVKRLQLLDGAEYSELLSIINNYNEDCAFECVTAFRKYLSNNINLKKFLKIFPIIVTTNLSCTYLGTPSEQFDIVMLDESAQCNIVGSLLPISRAKQLILVGDPQQLKPIIILDENVNDLLKKKYHISDEYDYIKNSIYTVFTSVDLINKESLLSHHYRCDKKIIDFSNKKYYHNKLKIKSAPSTEESLIFIDTKNINLQEKNERNCSIAEVNYILNYVKEHQNENIGVITPFVKQKELIKKILKDNNLSNVSVGTVHSYQGEQKDVIILSSTITNSTLKSTYDWVKNNNELINVAVSRPKKKLILLGNSEAIRNLNDNADDSFSELVDYVITNGKSTVSSSAISSLALGTRKLSEESEKNLNETVGHILSVINSNSILKSNIILGELIELPSQNSSLAGEKMDLVIFDKLGSKKIPILAIQLNSYNIDDVEDYKTNIKRKLLKCKNIEYLIVERDCARDYISLKYSLLSIVRKNKKI